MGLVSHNHQRWYSWVWSAWLDLLPHCGQAWIETQLGELGVAPSGEGGCVSLLFLTHLEAFHTVNYLGPGGSVWLAQPFPHQSR